MSDDLSVPSAEELRADLREKCAVLTAENARLRGEVERLTKLIHEAWIDGCCAHARLAACTPPASGESIPDDCPKCNKRWTSVYQRDAYTIMCLCSRCGQVHLAARPAPAKEPSR